MEHLQSIDSLNSDFLNSIFKPKRKQKSRHQHMKLLILLCAKLAGTMEEADKAANTEEVFDNILRSWLNTFPIVRLVDEGEDDKEMCLLFIHSSIEDTEKGHFFSFYSDGRIVRKYQSSTRKRTFPNLIAGFRAFYTTIEEAYSSNRKLRDFDRKQVGTGTQSYSVIARLHRCLIRQEGYDI